MTFIASVIARNGVAIIADSLVTSKKLLVEFQAFLKLIENKSDGKSEEEKKALTFSTNEIFTLFERKTSFTKDYENKLFEYDQFTSITIAGSVYLNNETIETLIQKKIKQNTTRRRSPKIKAIADKVEDLARFFEGEIKKQVSKEDRDQSTTLIVTHYNKTTKKSTIYKIELLPISKARHEKEPTTPLVRINLQPDYYKVVCDGQNRISERILFGEFDVVFKLVHASFDKFIKDFKIEAHQIPKDYVKDLLDHPTILTHEIYEDFKVAKLTDLSLQQAVDLAWLLMKIEIDFQKYTENIPTVGGQVKIAVIDEKGFRVIKGDDILPH